MIAKNLFDFYETAGVFKKTKRNQNNPVSLLAHQVLRILNAQATK